MTSCSDHVTINESNADQPDFIDVQTPNNNEGQNEEVAEESFEPIELSEEDKMEFLRRYRGRWQTEKSLNDFGHENEMKIYSEDRTNYGGQWLDFYSDQDTRFNPGVIDYSEDASSCTVPEFPVPDMMDGIQESYYGVFFSVGKITKISEDTYVLENLNYDDWEMFRGNVGQLEYLSIKDEDPDDNRMIVYMSYGQNDKIDDLFMKGREFYTDEELTRSAQQWQEDFFNKCNNVQ